VECRVEDGQVWHIGHGRLASLDPGQHRRVMQRHQRDQPVDLLHQFLIDHHGTAVTPTSMAHTVRHGPDLREVS
jgi:hypothetical protein